MWLDHQSTVVIRPLYFVFLIWFHLLTLQTRRWILHCGEESDAFIGHQSRRKQQSERHPTRIRQNVAKRCEFYSQTQTSSIVWWQAVVGSNVWCPGSSRFYRLVSRQKSALSSGAQAVVRYIVWCPGSSQSALSSGDQAVVGSIVWWQAVVGSIVWCPGSSQIYRLVPRQ